MNRNHADAAAALLVPGLLAGCSSLGSANPSPGETTTVTVTATPTAAESATKKPKKKKKAKASTRKLADTSESTSSAYYANCSEARSAGAAPLHTGDPGYSRKLDRDGDGVACE